MRVLGWVVKALLLLLLIGFALKNSEMITLRYLLGQEWNAPLSLVLLLFFGAGAALGALAALSVILRQRRELNALRQIAGHEPGRARGRQPDPELL